jgi:hypothetical protein
VTVPSLTKTFNRLLNCLTPTKIQTGISANAAGDIPLMGARHGLRSNASTVPPRGSQRLRPTMLPGATSSHVREKGPPCICGR